MLIDLRRILVGCFVLITTVLFAQENPNHLRVIVGDFSPIKGQLQILVFDSTVSSIGSENATKAIRKIIVPVTSKRLIINIDSLPKGRYAIEALHDENGNGKFEFIKEDYSISGRRATGKPNYKQAAIYYDGNNENLLMPLENELASTSHAYKNTVAFSPVFSYAPETNVLLGANMVKLFKHKGADSLTRTSYADVLGVATFNKQLVLEQNYLIFTPQEKFMINGFTGFSKFPQYYYGIGNHDSEKGKDVINYRQFRFEHLVMMKVHKKLFIGIGYRYNNIFHLTYKDSSRFALSPMAGSNGAVSSGVQFAVASDNRNNVYNTTKGHLIRVKSTFNSSAIGSKFNYNSYEVDLRTFMRPFQNRKDVLAFQGYGFFSNGNVPWNEMGTLGSDMIMRGYYSGRYRDKNYAAVQTEYRLSFNKMFGAVFFAGLGEVADALNHFSTYSIKPNVGTGARMAIDRRERLNLRLDVGFGQHTSNFYLTLAEAF